MIIRYLVLPGLTVVALALLVLAEHRSERFGQLDQRALELAQGGLAQLPVDKSWREDPRFGTVGKVVIALQSRRVVNEPARQTARVYALQVQLDNKILLAGAVGGVTKLKQSYGEAFLLRLHSDGSPDLSFGSAGKVFLQVGQSDDAILSLALQPDGKIVAAGVTAARSPIGLTAIYQPFIARFLENGQLDSSFHKTGLLGLALPYEGGELKAVAIQSDNRVVAVGSAAINARERQILVLRTTPQGDLDPRFGAGGIRTLTVGATSSAAYDLMLVRDGKVLLGGSAEEGTVFTKQGPLPGKHFVVARLDNRGNLDPTFNRSGFQRVSFGPGRGGVTRLTYFPSGQIGALGTFWNGSQTSFATVRLLADGKVDNKFHDTGFHLTPLGERAEFHSSGIAIQPSGAFVAVGQSRFGYLISRFLSDGTPDGSFHGGERESGNWVNIPFSHRGSNSQSIAVQADGKILAAGFFPEENQEFLALVRIQP